MEVSPHRYDHLTQSSVLSSPEIGGWDESSKLLTQIWFFLWPTPITRLFRSLPSVASVEEFPITHTIPEGSGALCRALKAKPKDRNKRCSYHLNYSGNSKGFGSAVPGTGDKDQTHISYYITAFPPSTLIFPPVNTIICNIFTRLLCVVFLFPWEKMLYLPYRYIPIA